MNPGESIPSQDPTEPDRTAGRAIAPYEYSHRDGACRQPPAVPLQRSMADVCGHE